MKILPNHSFRLLGLILAMFVGYATMAQKTITQYAIDDAVVSQAAPDSVVDLGSNNIKAYMYKVDETPYEVVSFIKFDISNLQGFLVDSASLSLSADSRSADLSYEITVRQSKSELWSGDTLTYNNKPADTNELGKFLIVNDAARRAFMDGPKSMEDYINEAVKKGQKTISFRISSTTVVAVDPENHNTATPWIGGAKDGSYGPQLVLSVTKQASSYALIDAVVSQASDTVVDIGNNLKAYMYTDANAVAQRVESFVKIDISYLKGRVVDSVNFSIRGSSGSADLAYDVVVKEVKSEDWQDDIIYTTKPAHDKTLGLFTLTDDASRQSLNTTTAQRTLVQYINNKVLAGAQTVSFRIQSDYNIGTPDNHAGGSPWIGGMKDNSYGPQLDLFVTPQISTYGLYDAVVSEGVDTVVNVGNNLKAYKYTNDLAEVKRIESFVKFDISHLMGSRVDSVNLSIRGTARDNATIYDIIVKEVKTEDWSENITYAIKPASDKTLGFFTLKDPTTSGRQNLNTSNKERTLVEYINNKLIAGETTVSFRIQSDYDIGVTPDHGASSPWFGGVSDGTYGPILDLFSTPTSLKRGTYDAIVSEASDTVVNIGKNNIKAYKYTDAADQEQRVESFVKFDISHLNGVAVDSVNLSIRGSSNSVDFSYEVVVKEVKTEEWTEDIIYTNKPAHDKTLGTFTLIKDAARQNLNTATAGRAFTEYINNKILAGATTVSFRIQSDYNIGKPTDHADGSPWIGGVNDGTYGPELYLETGNIFNPSVKPIGFTQAPGAYYPNVTLNIGFPFGSTEGATIYYTLDGSTPTLSSMVYDANTGISISPSAGIANADMDTVDVKAFAFLEGAKSSEMISGQYVVAPSGPVVFDTNPVLDYFNQVQVFMSTMPESASIFYSSDGSAPTQSYDAVNGILINTEGSTTIKAISVADVNDANSYQSAEYSATYNIVVPTEGIGSGPAGVGTSDNSVAGQPENVLWLSASTISGVADGAAVSLWEDKSGNGNNAKLRQTGEEADAIGDGILNTSAKYKDAPLYINNGINGLPALNFGDVGESPLRQMIIDDSEDLDGSAGISIFMVLNRKVTPSSNDAYGTFIQKRRDNGDNKIRTWRLENNGGGEPNLIQFIVNDEVTIKSDSVYQQDRWYIADASYNSGIGKSSLRSNGNLDATANYSKAINRGEDIPVLIAGFLKMDIAEIIIYKTGLNEAQHTIVNNYLATKYDMPLYNESGKSNLYSDANYKMNFIGIGKTLGLDGITEDSHLAASGGALRLTAASGGLDVSEYVFAAHDGGALSASIWNRRWNIHSTGESEVTLAFDFIAAGLTPPASAEGYILEYSDGTTTTELDVVPAFDGAKGLVSFKLIPTNGIYRLKNVNEIAAVVTPTFAPPAGSYAGAQSVVITSTTPDAMIYYTTDGTAPTDASTAYTAAVSVATDVTLKAIAYADGLGSSQVASAAYVITVLSSKDELKTGVSIYPNPSSDQLKLDMVNGINGDYKVSITDLAGRTMIERSFTKSAESFSDTFDLTSLQSGVYLLKIATGETNTVYKIVKR